MAQGDVFDLDVLLDEHFAGQLAESAQNQAAQRAAKTLDVQKLSQYGYTPPTSTDLGGMVADQARRDDAAKKGLMAEDEYFIKNYLPTASPQTKSEYTGVDFTGGAVGDAIRQIEFLPPDVGSDPDYVTRVLQKNYAKHDIPSSYDFNVRVDPSVNEFIFNDPLNNNKPTIVNPPGINKGDFLAFAEPVAAEIAGGLALGAAGALVGPVTATTGAWIGETLGTYIWRLNNLNYLDKQGYLPEDYNIHERAMKDAQMTALFSFGGLTVFKLFKLAAGVSNLPGKLMLSEKEFLESFDKVAKDLGEDVTAMTSPQVMIRAADEGVDIKSPVQGLEAGLRDEAQRGSPQGQVIREKIVEQEKGGVKLTEALFGGQGVTRELAEEEAGAGMRAARGREFRDTAQEALETNPRLIEVENAITDLNIQSDDIFRSVADKSMDPNLAGKQLRETVELAQESAGTLVDDAYTKATRLAGFRGNAKPYDYTPLRKIAKRYKNILEQQVWADPKNEVRIAKLLKRTESNVKKPHSVFVEDLSNLRSTIRAERLAGNNVDELMKLKKSLENIREKTLKDSGNEEALAVFRKAEGEYRSLMKNFKNDNIKRLLGLQSVSDDLYRQGDRTAYEGFVSFLRNTVTKNPDGTFTSPEFIDDILFDPKNAGGLLGLKGGLRQAYINDVVDTTGDILRPKSPRSHETFMRKNKNVLEKFFTKDEMAEFTNAEQFIKEFKKRELALIKTKDALLKNTNLADIAGNWKTPEDLFKNTWRPGGITATAELFDAVTTHGSRDLIDSYKAYIFKDLMEKTQRKGTLGRDIFDGNSLKNYVDQHGDALEIWFGKKFKSQLTDISKKLKALDDPNVSALKEEDLFIMKSANSLARAYVGIFTTPGRILTAIKTVMGGQATNKELALLIDPDKLYKAIMKDQWQKDPVVRGAVRELGRIFYRETGDEPTLEATVTPEETMLFGRGYQERVAAGEEEEFQFGGHVIKDLGNLPLKYGNLWGGSRPMGPPADPQELMLDPTKVTGEESVGDVRDWRGEQYTLGGGGDQWTDRLGREWGTSGVNAPPPVPYQAPPITPFYSRHVGAYNDPPMQIDFGGHPTGGRYTSGGRKPKAPKVRKIRAGKMGIPPEDVPPGWGN